MDITSEKSVFLDALEKHLALKECKLEDGSLVSNIDGICQSLIGKALAGDMLAVDFIAKLTGKK